MEDIGILMDTIYNDKEDEEYREDREHEEDKEDKEDREDREDKEHEEDKEDREDKEHEEDKEDKTELETVKNQILGLGIAKPQIQITSIDKINLPKGSKPKEKAMDTYKRALSEEKELKFRRKMESLQAKQAINNRKFSGQPAIRSDEGKYLGR